MKNTLRRTFAQSTRWIATHGLDFVRVFLALLLVWFGIVGLSASSNPQLRDTSFEYSVRVLTIISVGHITDSFAPRLVCTLDCLITLSLLFRLWRLSLWMLWPRLLLNLLSLVMLRDAAFVHFPFVPTAGGQNVLLHGFLLMTAIVLAAQHQLAILASHPQTASLLESRVLTEEEKTTQRRKLHRRLAIGLPTLLLLGLATSWVWPRYLRWFHARQEAAVLNEKLSGKLLKKSMPMSKLLHRKITTWVYLPPGYERLDERFPVVYVMHGAPGEVRDCFVKGRIQDAAEELIHTRQIRPLIIVGWDGEGPEGPSDITNFLDRSDGTWPMETFITKELVPYIDRTYRTIPKPEARALIGVSAGGYGAVNLTIKHPNTWKVAASHSGFFDPDDDATNMTDILGPPGPLWDANNPMKTIKNITPQQNLHIYADAGQGDDLLDELQKFQTMLEAEKINHVVNVFPGRHTWEYWSTHFYDSLKFADSRFRIMEEPGDR